MKIFALRALRDNYIWMITDAGTGTAWAVDPGIAAPVMTFLSENNLSLKGVLLTHHHADHSGGIHELQQSCDSLQVVGSPLSPFATLTDRLGEGSSVSCGSLKLQVIPIPGHTLDHQAYYGGGMLFSGDTLFSAGCGRIFEGTVPQMYASLQKLAALPDATQIYCGHEYTAANLAFAETVEPQNRDIKNKIQALKKSEKNCTLPSTLSDEKLFNPFLRCSEPAVVSAAERCAGRSLTDPVSVFGVLREWKNTF